MIELEDTSAFLKLYPETTRELLEFSVANISEELIQENPHVIFFQNTENRSICILAEDSEEALQEEIEKVCGNIVEAMWRFMKIKVWRGKTDFCWRNVFLSMKKTFRADRETAICVLRSGWTSLCFLLN